jgi:hypothetical protein
LRLVRWPAQDAFACTTGTEKECILPIADEGAGGQIKHQTAIHLRVKTEIEIIQSPLWITESHLFRSIDVYTPALQALGAKPTGYTLASFRCDLSKLRAKALVEQIPHSRRYRLAGKGYSVCVLSLKLSERVYAPLTAGLLKPFAGDRKLADEKRCTLHRLYQRIVDDLDALLCAVGLKAAA